MQELGSNAPALPSFILCHPEGHFLGPWQCPKRQRSPKGLKGKVVLAQLSVLLGSPGACPINVLVTRAQVQPHANLTQ